MNKAFQPPSRPSPNCPLKLDEKGTVGEPQAREEASLSRAAQKAPSDEAWKSSALALELIDCLKDSNAQRH
jgi:hypothetical protein